MHICKTISHQETSILSTSSWAETGVRRQGPLQLQLSHWCVRPGAAVVTSQRPGCADARDKEPAMTQELIAGTRKIFPIHMVMNSEKNGEAMVNNDL